MENGKQWWGTVQSLSLPFTGSCSFLTALSLSLPPVGPKYFIFLFFFFHTILVPDDGGKCPYSRAATGSATLLGECGFRLPREKGGNEFPISNALTGYFIKKRFCPQYLSFLWSCLKRKQQQSHFVGTRFWIMVSPREQVAGWAPRRWRPAACPTSASQRGSEMVQQEESSWVC